MAAGLLFQIKRGDLTPVFRAQCKDGNTPVDLTAATTVRFLLRMRDGTTPVIAATAVKEDQVANTGWVHYNWAAGDTDASGTYVAEVEVTWSDGKPQTFPADGYATVLVVADLG